MAYKDQHFTPIEVQAKQSAYQIEKIAGNGSWGKEEASILSQANRGLKTGGYEFAHTLARELGFTDLVHNDKGNTRYFEMLPRGKDPINHFEAMSFDEDKRAYLPSSAEVAFMIPILGLRDTRDVGIVLDNMLQAGNLPALQAMWKSHAAEWLEIYGRNPSNKERVDFVSKRYDITPTHFLDAAGTS